MALSGSVEGAASFGFALSLLRWPSFPHWEISQGEAKIVNLAYPLRGRRAVLRDPNRRYRAQDVGGLVVYLPYAWFLSHC